jgi:hypothetical protein
MKESERLAEKGIRTLAARGWPPEEIEELVTTLMGAGMAHFLELQVEKAAHDEALIQKAVRN